MGRTYTTPENLVVLTVSVERQTSDAIRELAQREERSIAQVVRRIFRSAPQLNLQLKTNKPRKEIRGDGTQTEKSRGTQGTQGLHPSAGG